MIVEDTGRDDDPRSRCSLIGSDVGVYIFNNVYTKVILRRVSEVRIFPYRCKTVYLTHKIQSPTRLRFGLETVRGCRGSIMNKKEM